MTEAKGRKRSVRDHTGLALSMSADAVVAKANEQVALSDRLCPLLQRKCIKEECAWFRKSRRMCGAVEM